MNIANELQLPRALWAMVKAQDAMILPEHLTKALKVFQQEIQDYIRDEYKKYIFFMPAPTDTEIGLVGYGHKIDAIKSYRERNHCSLTEAKDKIEKQLDPQKELRDPWTWS